MLWHIILTCIGPVLEFCVCGQDAQNNNIFWRFNRPYGPEKNFVNF